MGSDVRAGSAFVELLTKDVSFSKGLAAAQAKLQSFGRATAAAGAALVGLGVGLVTPLLLAAQAYADAGGALDDAAQRVGASASDMSTLGYAAEQTGSSLETLEKSIAKLNKNQSEAAAGSKTMRESFAELGLDWRKLADMDPAQRFREVAKALAAVDDPATRTRLSMDLLGKSAVELNPLFNEGAAGIARLEEEARALGIAMGDEDATAAADFGDALDRLWKTCKGIWRTIGGALVPVLTPLADGLSLAAAGVGRFMRENQGLVQTIFYVGSALVAAGAALVGLGFTFAAAGTAIGGLLSTAGAIASVFAALTSPIALVTAALVGGVAAWLYYTESGGAALAWLNERFGEAFGFITQTLGAIGAALASGDLAAAGQVAWSALQVVWTQGVAWLLETWQGFADGCTDVVTHITTDIAKGLAAGMEIAGMVWEEGIRAMQDVWTAFYTYVTGTLDWLTTRIAQALAYIGQFVGLTKNAEKLAADMEADRQKREGERQAVAANAIGGRADAAQAARDERSSRLDATLAALDQQREASRGSGGAAVQPAVDAAKAAAAAANEAWKKNTEAASKMPMPTLPDGSRFSPGDASSDFAGAAEKIGVTGTFSGAVAGLLGTGGDAAERTAKASEKSAKSNEVIAKNITDLNRKVETGGASFA